MMQNTAYVAFVLVVLMLAACSIGTTEPEATALVSPTEAVEILESVSGVVYVNAANVAGPWDGETWATAFQGVQEGLDAASTMGGGEVWVAQGVYLTTDTSDRQISIELREGVALYGGFDGTEIGRDQRDWEANLTVLSGDIGAPGDLSDNALHVVVGANEAIIDGFTITGGNALPSRPPGESGGERPTHTTPEEIVASSAATAGGGLINFQASPIVRNCIITGNQAGKGGEVYNMTRGNGSPMFVNVTISNNFGHRRGGGMSNDLSTHPLLVNVRFIGNRTDEKGGGLYNDFRCSPTIINGLFAGNQADTAAAIGNDGSSSPLILHSTFAGNVAADMGAGLYQGTYNPSGTGGNNPVVRNSILWGNMVSTFGPVSVYNWADSAPDIRFSIVEGGYPGEANLDVDPVFRDPASGDFAPAAGSPAIDAGTAEDMPLNVDILGLARSEAPDIGAFEQGAEGRPSLGAAKIQAIVLESLAAEATSPTPPSGPPPGGAPAWVPPPTEAALLEIPEKVVFVNAGNQRGPWDGSSWGIAFQTVQEGIDAAVAAGGGEVWVAAGTYHPTTDGDRAKPIALKPGVAVYGGFAGVEDSRVERDWETLKTILSGDIGAAGEVTDNSYHVVTGAQNALLDGVTVRDGYANGEREHRHGGGMLNYFAESSATVRNVTFTNNHAVNGGAVYNYNYAYVVFENCTFASNRAEFGGAAHLNVGANGEIRASLFQDNHALYRGGAVVVDYGSSPRFEEVEFVGNSTDGHGGAVWVNTRASQLGSSRPVFANCSFEENRAALRGGAIQNNDQSTTIILDSIFKRNRAGTGGGAIANDNAVTVTIAGNVFIDNDGGSGRDAVETDESSQVSTEYGSDSPPASPSTGGPPPGGPAPPQEAIDACHGLAEGDACQIQTQQGTVDGSCAVLQGQLACRPEGGPGGQVP